MADRRQWYCSTVDTPGGKRLQGGPTSLVTMGVLDKGKVWPRGKQLRLRFLRGEPALHQRVLAAARQWLVPGVKLDLAMAGADDAADLRIDFNPDAGSWSYVGTDNLLINPGQPTMNLGWAALDTPEADFSSVVVHEFGHALGLLHEHNHPDAVIHWNKPAVYADLGGPPNMWPKSTIDSNVFAAFDRASVITTGFDPESVMIYTVPSHWTLDGKSYLPLTGPSEGDKATILSVYA